MLEARRPRLANVPCAYCVSVCTTCAYEHIVCSSSPERLQVPLSPPPLPPGLGDKHSQVPEAMSGPSVVQPTRGKDLDQGWEVKHRCLGLPHAWTEIDFNFFSQGVPGQPGTKGGPGDKVR